jgi:hypothetical protein
MMMEAAVAMANVERWVQESVASAAREKAEASILPAEILNSGKKDSYEVSVVDGFMRLGAVSFAAHGSEAVWERTFPTGKPGRPLAVDVCLFNAKRTEEARIEFGLYTLGKMRSDAHKLGAELPAGAPTRVANFIILWRTREQSVSGADTEWRDTCISDAIKASTARYTVKMEVASEQDMFVADRGGRRKVQVGLFSVRPATLDGESDESTSSDVTALGT